MNAFIAMEKYIVKEEKDFGVGVPVTLNEDIAMYESSRKKDVQSYNNWLLIGIPDELFFLDVTKPVMEQREEILKILGNQKFLGSLFVHEARILLNDLEARLAGKNLKEETARIFDEFTAEKFEFLKKFQTGSDFFRFVNSKCVTHDKGKSSALLYNFGIKGCRYRDDTGERFLLFNAKRDIEPLEFRHAALEDSRLNA